MIDDRRSMFKALGAAGLAHGAWAGGALRALAALGLYGSVVEVRAQASALPMASRSPAFRAETSVDALRQIVGAAPLLEVGEQQIQLQIPELAENGAMVPVSVNSLIPGTRQIMLLIDRNPHPLVASFHFPDGTEPGFQTRVKMAQSSRLRILVQATQGKDLRYFTTTKETRVTLGGCGNSSTSADLPPNIAPEPMRLRASHADGVTEVRVLVKHIMESGQAQDPAGRTIAAHYITEVQAHHISARGAPRLVLQAQWSTAIAQNPILFFKFKGGAPGDKVVVQWVDNLGARRSDETLIH